VKQTSGNYFKPICVQNWNIGMEKTVFCEIYMRVFFILIGNDLITQLLSKNRDRNSQWSSRYEYKVI